MRSWQNDWVQEHSRQGSSIRGGFGERRGGGLINLLLVSKSIAPGVNTAERSWVPFWPDAMRLIFVANWVPR